ncbi:hypothetical protein ONZ43_g5278 [Nemania bipapillata]|uniref:Uncharacterized protein n=1 Tax=Nemania bipapillata TaxID=110536 RepID=A0ACC2ICJ8_9PEZI|nr:hypothetical protein ONZ43_g5278 [Nemania bipapillata]
MVETDVQQDDLGESAAQRADVELKRRRERGRESQARFRKKQAQASQETLAENKGMAAIADIVEAARPLSPRLDYGIWVDARSAVRVSKPPVEIIPFLGAGRYTFAGHLYWACTDYLISLCRRVTAPHSPSLPSPWLDGHSPARLTSRQAEDRIWIVLQHSPPVPSVRLAQALAEAQREYRDTGYMQGDSPACNEGIGALMRQEIEADYLARGQDLAAWMTIAELERHVQRQLGSEAFSRLEKAIAAPSKAMDSDLVPGVDANAIIRLLINNLAESFICFGDGPR